jgi:putative colanic acid biosynthesis glycosyltransferase WcaI
VRVCFFNRSYWPEAGATGRLLAQLAEDLGSRHGCDVTVVAGRPVELPQDALRLKAEATDSPSTTAASAFRRKESHRGVQIIRAGGTTFDRRRFVGRALNYVTYFASACVAALAAPRTDVAVGFSDPPIIGFAALVAARRSGGRFVLVCQDLFPEVTVLLDDFHSRLVDRGLFWINRFLMRRADRVVVVGEAMKARIVATRGIEASKIVVIHNWCDRAQVAPVPRRNPVAVETGLADRFVVMHSGNMGFAQDLDTLLDAAASLRDLAEVIVAIVGSGARRAAIEARVRDEGLTNVRLLPYQPEDRLSEALGSADVHVVSMKRGLEGCLVPSKLYGVLAAGRAYIAAADSSTEIARIATETGSGIVVPPGDPASLASAVRRLRDDRELTNRLAAAALAAAAFYDRPRQVARYFDLFASLAGSPAVVADAATERVGR